MKKAFAFLILFGGLILTASAYAVDFDGSENKSSTLDNEQAAQGSDPYQGNTKAEANS